MSSHRRIQEQEGMVIMLDSLGTRNTTIGSPIDFYEKMQKFLFYCFRISDFTSEDTVMIKGKSGGYRHYLSQSYKAISSSISFSILGDTVIITTQVPNRFNKDKALGCFIRAHIPYLSLIMLSALESGLFFRGVASFGKYLTHSFTDRNDAKIGVACVGDAVSDAANWVEALDWIGIALTPKTGLLWEGSNPWFWLDVNGFMKYDAPLSNSLKNKNSIELWCATWPMRIFLEHPEFHEIQDYQMISKIIKSRVARYFDQMLYIPKGAESKYQNTLKFVDGVFVAMEKNHKAIAQTIKIED